MPLTPSVTNYLLYIIIVTQTSSDYKKKIVLHGGEGVMNDKMMILLGLASINYSLLKQRVCPK
ncbi:MAG TPA: hypothetical protein K8V19_05155, partial [Globicatella sulfidifaciens]|nr:hypothetical protein [Globicatella sulfidifaciens]